MLVVGAARQCKEKAVTSAGMILEAGNIFRLASLSISKTSVAHSIPSDACAMIKSMCHTNLISKGSAHQPHVIAHSCTQFDASLETTRFRCSTLFRQSGRGMSGAESKVASPSEPWLGCGLRIKS